MRSTRPGRSATSLSVRRVDEEIHNLSRQRTTLLRRRPPRLTHAAEPTFGSTSTGSGDRLVGVLAYRGPHPIPKNVPHWDWEHVNTPSAMPEHKPPNLFGTFSTERLPTSRNQWSIAQRSMTYPLKSILLDDDQRNIPRHRTRTELLADRKKINIPHMSFDVDMDGVVSELDMKYAKAYDLDGDGILNKGERQRLRQAMATDLYKGRKVVTNLAEKVISDTEIEEKAAKLTKSENFTEDFNTLHQRQCRNKIAGSTGGINVLQHHFRARENRDYGLGSDHNVVSVKTHNVGFEDGSGSRRRCISRTQLLDQRRKDFRETAKLAAFKDDGKSQLFKRQTDNSIAPTPI